MGVRILNITGQKSLDSLGFALKEIPYKVASINISLRIIREKDYFCIWSSWWSSFDNWGIAIYNITIDWHHFYYPTYFELVILGLYWCTDTISGWSVKECLGQLCGMAEN